MVKTVEAMTHVELTLSPIPSRKRCDSVTWPVQKLRSAAFKLIRTNGSLLRPIERHDDDVTICFFHTKNLIVAAPPLPIV